MHDIILFYGMTEGAPFNVLMEPYSEKSKHKARRTSVLDKTGRLDQSYTDDTSRQKSMRDVWEISYLNSQSKERLGYPTQKPLELLERIIMASSKEGDLILDPFCGCGTSIHAAEKLGRRWIGIDVSKFSTGLIKTRLTTSRRKNELPLLAFDDIQTSGIPETPEEARELADRDKFEFEKCMCGLVGAEGMFHDPGTKGADGGVDGVLKFYPLRWGQKPSQKEPDLAIVQVKGGKVAPDAVRALGSTVRRYEATAGVMICFDRYMRTVENNRDTDTFETATGNYPRIQGLSVEAMLRGAEPNLPNLMRKAA